MVKLTAAELDPADVERLLVDRSILVRLWARRRWQEMGNDPATTYWALARSAAEPTVRAAAFIGLAETGTAVGHEETLELVRSTELPLRKAGLSLLAGHATGEDVPLLLSFVAGDHRRVPRLAGEVLARSPQLWTPSDLLPLKAADDPELRRRAWRIHRRLGGWEAVIADLEVLHDLNPQLAALGRQPAAPMYRQPTDSQRQRLTSLLATAPLHRDQFLAIAMAAGLPGPAHGQRAES